MAIPDYQSLMLPLLKLLSNGQELSLREAIGILSEKFQLTDEEKKELLPSGLQPVIDNRVGWARTYLKKAGLVESTRRGYIIITHRGLEALQQNPSEINHAFLVQYPEYVEFKSRKIPDKNDNGDGKTTPEEMIEEGYQRIRQELAQELLSQIKKNTPNFFEKLVVELLVKMGYGGSRRDAGEAIGRAGDEGIDGIIKEDRLGLDIIYIQAKRWENTVGRDEIQKFVRALQGKRAKKGVFITTSDFTSGAISYIQNIDTKVILIDGDRLTQLMIDFDIGVSNVSTYEIKKIDSDYFVDE